MTTEQKTLLRDVDTPPAPSLPLPTEVRHNSKRVGWRGLIRAQVAQAVAAAREASGQPPKIKEIVAMFPAKSPEHCWEGDPANPIKNRRRIWVQEVRRQLGGKRKKPADQPLLEG